MSYRRIDKFEKNVLYRCSLRLAFTANKIDTRPNNHYSLKSKSWFFVLETGENVNGGVKNVLTLTEEGLGYLTLLVCHMDALMFEKIDIKVP